MSLAGCQIIPADLNFHLQKCLEIFDKNSADKIQSKNYKGVNPPCLMPIRDKNSCDFIVQCARKEMCHTRVSHCPPSHFFVPIFVDILDTWSSYQIGVCFSVGWMGGIIFIRSFLGCIAPQCVCDEIKYFL